MSIDSEIGGPGAEDRQLVYARMGMSNHAIRHAENMVYGSPSRKVGKGALTNVVTRFDSLKNGKPRVLESHTCELVCAYELELDPDVMGYHAQVPCRGIQRLLPNGRRHVASANLDFLVFRQGRLELVECKPQAWLLKNAEPHSDWTQCDGIWQHEPYQAFASEHEVGFSVWSPPHEPGIYLQNLEAIYGVMRGGMGTIAPRAVDRAIAAIARQPASVTQLCEEIDGFSVRTALWMLGKWLAFGPLKSTPILMTDQFHLYVDRQHAEAVDSLALQQCGEIYRQPEFNDPLLRARTTDVKKSRRRLARVEAIARGEVPQTERMRQLAMAIEAAVAQGRTPLSACLTRYEGSGNRLSRLCPEQDQAAETTIVRYWNTGRAKTPKSLYWFFEKECAQLGTEACGKTAFYRRLRRENPMRHALATGGLRGYQAIRAATDPRMRSLPPIGYGHTLHIDSSDLDNRIAKNILKLMPACKAKFYIGVDGSSRDTMAHAFIFGPARTDGVAILLREYVRRHRCLPQFIHADRGPENRSWWIETLAEGYLSLRWSPTAGSAWNGIAENAIKQVNCQVAHRLTGSTAPDQKGRKIDGRFKSRKNAKTSFEMVLEQFLTFIYDDLPNTPTADGQTPLEKKAEALATLGDFGVPCELNEDFLLRTSIKVDVKKNINPQRGVRTEEGYFTSDELIDALRFHEVEELRSDCEDPTILRARIGGRWVKAFHSRVQSMALLPQPQKLFDLMYAPIRRAEARVRAEIIGRKRHTRLELANFATASTPEVSPCDLQQAQVEAQPSSESDQPTTDSFPDSRRVLWNDLALCDERGARI